MLTKNDLDKKANIEKIKKVRTEHSEAKKKFNHNRSYKRVGVTFAE